MKETKTKAELLVIQAKMIQRRDIAWNRANSIFLGKAARRNANARYLSLVTDIKRINSRILQIGGKE